MAKRRHPPSAFSLFAFQDIITAVTGIMLLICLILALELINRVEAAPPATSTGQDEDIEAKIAKLEGQIAALNERMRESDRGLGELPTLDPRTLESKLDDLRFDISELEDEIDKAKQERRRLEEEHGDATADADAKSQGHNDRVNGIKDAIDDIDKKQKALEGGETIVFRTRSVSKETWVVEISDQFTAAPLGKSQEPIVFRSVSQFVPWANRLNPSRTAFLFVVKPNGIERYTTASDALLENTDLAVGIYLIGADQKVLDKKTGAGGP